MRAGLALALAWSLPLLAGCMTPLEPQAFVNAQPQFSPETFFAGKTTSSGVLEDRTGAPTKRLHVDGTGEAIADGVRLKQTVSVEGDGPYNRSWVMRRDAEHHITARLTDASGPVEGQLYGNVLHLEYPMKSPSLGTMEQWLYLQPDGVTVVNEATIRVAGIVVAHISERITHSGE